VSVAFRSHSAGGRVCGFPPASVYPVAFFWAASPIWGVLLKIGCHRLPLLSAIRALTIVATRRARVTGGCHALPFPTARAHVAARLSLTRYAGSSRSRRQVAPRSVDAAGISGRSPHMGAGKKPLSEICEHPKLGANIHGRFAEAVFCTLRDTSLTNGRSVTSGKCVESRREGV
jgi:hypothetical protein